MKLLFPVTLVVLPAALAAASPQKFDLSSGKAELYSAERGYGFEEGATLKPGAGAITCEKPPFYWSARVPEEGNYRITVTLGDREAMSRTLSRSRSSSLTNTGWTRATSKSALGT
jgi:hypothetical protein